MSGDLPDGVTTFSAEGLRDKDTILIDASDIVGAPFCVEVTHGQIMQTMQEHARLERSEGRAMVESVRDTIAVAVKKKLPKVKLRSKGKNPQLMEFNTDCALLVMANCYLQDLPLPVMGAPGKAKAKQLSSGEMVTVTTNRCCHCGATSEQKMAVCGRCKVEPYCSAACQKAAWRVHKLTCGLEDSKLKATFRPGRAAAGVGGSASSSTGDGGAGPSSSSGGGAGVGADGLDPEGAKASKSGGPSTGDGGAGPSSGSEDRAGVGTDGHSPEGTTIRKSVGRSTPSTVPSNNDTSAS